MAVESIAVFHIVMRHQKREEAEVGSAGVAWGADKARSSSAGQQQRGFHARDAASRACAARHFAWHFATALHLCRPGDAPAHLLQRRREAYRRYCQLRDRGKLKDGNNPPLSAADLITPTISQAREHSAAGVAASGAENGAASGVVHAAEAPPPELAAAADPAGQQKRGRERQERSLNGCFRGILPSARWPGQHTVRGR